MIKFREKEKIVAVKRRHYMVFVLDLLPVLIIFLFLGGALLYFLFFGLPEQLASITNNYFDLKKEELVFHSVFSFLIATLFLWNLSFVIITKHYLDYWIITDRRTIHVELRLFFSRFYSSIYHDKIQDTTVDVRGFLPTIMNYGNMKIQTAGAFKKFIFQQIPDPHETKRILFEESSKYSKIKNNHE
jgi:hypothetical protein